MYNMSLFGIVEAVSSRMLICMASLLNLAANFILRHLHDILFLEEDLLDALRFFDFSWM